MAEATGLRNNALPYPIYAQPFGIVFPLLDADGDPISPSSPDSEISKNGDTFADCTNEATEIATTSGSCYLLLTATEMTADVIVVQIKSTGAKTTVVTLYPRKLVMLRSGTAAGGAAGSITLDSGASAVDDFYNGCVVAGVLDSTNEVRIITDYAGSTKIASVTPNWNTTPDSDDTFIVYLPEGRQINEANVELWNGTSVPAEHTAGYPIVTIKDGTGTGEIDTNAGAVVSVTTTGTATNVTTVNGLAAGVITAASIAAAALNGKGDWNIGKTGYSLAATGLDLVLAASTGVVEIAKAVWDRVLTGATHNAATSAGKRLREITNSVSQSGTAQAGSTNTITLAAAASSTDGTYDPAIVRISGGTGAGQARLIIHYTGSTRVAVVDRDWRTSPDNTSEYEIIASPNLHSTNEGLAQGGGASTITLNASASSTDDVYNGQLVVIRTGPGQDQSRIITDYVGSTKVATVGEAWATNPTSSSGYMIWPVGRALVTEYVSGQEPPTTGAIATAVAAEIGNGSTLTEAGGTGDHLTALATQASVNDLPTNAELALRTLLAAEYGTAADQAAIKAKTDQLTFTQANVLDANILYVNGTQVTGDGETGTEWGPA